MIPRIISGQDLINNTYTRHISYSQNTKSLTSSYLNIINNLGINIPKTTFPIYKTDILYKVSSQHLTISDFVKVITISKTFKTITIDKSASIKTIPQNYYIYPVMLRAGKGYSGRIRINMAGKTQGNHYNNQESFFIIYYSDNLQMFNKLETTNTGTMNECICCLQQPSITGLCVATNLLRKQDTKIEIL